MVCMLKMHEMRSFVRKGNEGKTQTLVLVLSFSRETRKCSFVVLFVSVQNGFTQGGDGYSSSPSPQRGIHL